MSYRFDRENGGLIMKKIVPSIYLGIIDTNRAESRREELLRMLPQINDEEIKKREQKVTTVQTIPDRDFLRLTRNCTSYRRRGYMTKPVSDEEERYPIAYVIQIYKDLVQIERLPMAIYRPHNWRNLERWRHLPTPSIPVRLVKGGCHFAVTRCFVRYILFDKRAHHFKNWTSKTYFPDEHYFQSFSHSPKTTGSWSLHP
ncbi:hypothetical protein LSH36_175g05004 [Paralvinella palmiformis]|uniref:Uncharacterized protein n=1 Tax=Paralvinella palmiformis TaxID=53620 RepID=A0AAD9N7D7_9ANNE|nr:hypothetical protein LSH36_175g05004 [Paralvinella palmiformis]